MYERRLAALHEAAHGVVASSLALRHFCTIKDDGSGLTRYDDPAAVSALPAEDRAMLAVAGNVGEELAITNGSDLKAAVRRTYELSGTHDADMLVLAMRDMGWRGRDTVHREDLRAAVRARAILCENQAEFYRLAQALERDGIGRVDMGPAPAATGGRPMGPNAAAAAAAARSVASGHAAGPAELRSMLSDAKAAGHTVLAKLLEASIAGREGRDVEPFKERRVMGQLLVERELATDGR